MTDHLARLRSIGIEPGESRSGSETVVKQQIAAAFWKMCDEHELDPNRERWLIFAFGYIAGRDNYAERVLGLLKESKSQ